MYTVFGADKTLRAFLSVYALLIVGAAAMIEVPTSPVTALRWALISVGLFMVVTTAVAGWAATFSPWRLAFRWWPQLNEWIYPDLNGVWYGKTESNWGVIETKRMAAAAGGGLQLGDLPSVPLQEGEIAMEVRATLFGISVRSKVSATNGTSKTLSSRADKFVADNEYRLSYLYRQETPEPVATDEGSHDGAASLQVDLSDPLSMRGVYWTRRKWREGMNTAGMIKVTRVAREHAPSGADLLQFARERATRNA